MRSLLHVPIFRPDCTFSFAPSIRESRGGFGNYLNVLAIIWLANLVLGSLKFINVKRFFGGLPLAFKMGFSLFANRYGHLKELWICCVCVEFS